MTLLSCFWLPFWLLESVFCLHSEDCCFLIEFTWTSDFICSTVCSILFTIISHLFVLEQANYATHRLLSCISLGFFLFLLTYSISSHISYMKKATPDKCSWNWPAHHISTTVMFKHTARFICILYDSVIYWDRSWPFAFLNSFLGCWYS